MPNLNKVELLSSITHGTIDGTRNYGIGWYEITAELADQWLSEAPRTVVPYVEGSNAAQGTVTPPLLAPSDDVDDLENQLAKMTNMLRKYEEQYHIEANRDPLSASLPHYRQQILALRTERKRLKELLKASPHLLPGRSVGESVVVPATTKGSKLPPLINDLSAVPGIDKLTDKQMEVYSMKFGRGMSVAQIAAYLGRSRKTIDERLAAGKLKLGNYRDNNDSRRRQGRNTEEDRAIQALDDD